MWSAKSVTKITKASTEQEWDGESLYDEADLLATCPSLAYVDEITEESEAAYKDKKVYGMEMEDKEKPMFKSYMSHCMKSDAEMTNTKDMDMDKTMSACAVQYKKDRETLMEENEAGLTDKQKKLPSWLQKSILKKQKGNESKAG